MAFFKKTPPDTMKLKDVDGNVIYESATATTDKELVEQAARKADRDAFRKADLRGLDLTGIALTDKDLSGANFSNTNFNNADLQRSQLPSEIRQCSFVDADLGNTNIKHGQITRSDFTRTNLAGAALVAASIRESNFTQANLAVTSLSATHIINSQFNEARFDSAKLYKTNVHNSQFERAIFDEANLKGAVLNDCNTVNASFARTDLTNAEFFDFMSSEFTEEQTIKEFLEKIGRQKDLPNTNYPSIREVEQISMTQGARSASEWQTVMEGLEAFRTLTDIPYSEERFDRLNKAFHATPNELVSTFEQKLSPAQVSQADIPEKEAEPIQQMAIPEPVVEPTMEKAVDISSAQKANAKTSDFAKAMADKLIEQLQAGTSPFQRPWKTLAKHQEHNPTTGQPYRGANAFWLSLQGRDDPRWMTFNQAKEAGYSIKKGEKGVPLTKYVFEKAIPMTDDNGNKVLDEQGKPKMEKVKLDKPIVVNFYVFNAEQISGIEPYKAPELAPEWEVNDRAEALLQASGAKITHKPLDAAFYRPATDEIIMPPRAAFDSPSKYYATALHELGHWTGHESRLNRELVGLHDDKQAYAREELRAEMSSLLLTKSLGIPHDFDNHAAYVDSWVKLLKDQPNEIFAAARDADKIHQLVMQFDREREQTVEQKNSEMTM